MPRANPDVNYEISIHALLAESDRSLLLPVRGSRISIHALLAESDIDAAVEVAHIRNFYPRSPCGERPPFSTALRPAANISIHALLAESDPPTPCAPTRNWYFYPRSPCGERRIEAKDAKIAEQFLSTLSLRRATWWLRCWKLAARDISIHALLAESDFCTPLTSCACW